MTIGYKWKYSSFSLFCFEVIIYPSITDINITLFLDFVCIFTSSFKLFFFHSIKAYHRNHKHILDYDCCFVVISCFFGMTLVMLYTIIYMYRGCMGVLKIIFYKQESIFFTPWPKPNERDYLIYLELLPFDRFVMIVL